MLSGVCVFVIWWYPMVSVVICSITFLSTEGYYSSIFYIFQCFTWNIFNFIFFDPGNVSRETLPGTDCQKIIFASLLKNLNFFESSDFFLLDVKDTPPGFLSPYLPSRNFTISWQGHTRFWRAEKRSCCFKALANTQSIACGLFIAWTHFCSGKTACTWLWWIFVWFLVFETQTGWRPSRRKGQKAPERHAVRRVCSCQLMVAAYGLFDILILSMFHVKHWQAVSQQAYQYPQPSAPDAAQGQCHIL